MFKQDKNVIKTICYARFPQFKTQNNINNQHDQHYNTTQHNTMYNIFIVIAGNGTAT